MEHIIFVIDHRFFVCSKKKLIWQQIDEIFQIGSEMIEQEKCDKQTKFDLFLKESKRFMFKREIQTRNPKKKNKTESNHKSDALTSST